MLTVFRPGDAVHVAAWTNDTNPEPAPPIDAVPVIQDSAGQRGGGKTDGKNAPFFPM